MPPGSGAGRGVKQIRTRPHQMLYELQQPCQNRRAYAGPYARQQHRQPEARSAGSRQRRRDFVSGFLRRIQVLHPS
jgi:hypothetical protein